MQRTFLCESGGKKDSSGREINEDLVVLGDGYAILMDGATGLGDFNFFDNMTNAEWYVKECGSFISEELKNNPSSTITQIVKECILHIQKEIAKLEKEKNYKLQPHEEPSSSLIILKEENDFIEIFSLGDSVTMLKTVDNFHVLREENLCALDNKVLARMVEIADEKGIDVIKTRNESEIQEMLILNRNKKNSNEEDGYWVLGTSVDSIAHAKSLKVRKTDVKKIVCVSDGFNYDLLNLTTEQFYEKCNLDSIHEYARLVRKSEHLDSGCNKSPRFKVSDDLSGLVWIN